MKIFGWMSTLIFLLPASVLSQDLPADLRSWIDAGDAHWESRALGAQGSQADPKEIDQAVAAYQRALADAPDSLAVPWRLMRALYFKGVYTTKDREEKKRIFREGKTIGEAFLLRVRAEASRLAGRSLYDSDPVQMASFFKDAPDISSGFFWLSANWGEWALAFGKLQAVRQGAATRIRELAEAVIVMDPNFFDGGGYRVLGRLHHQTPAVPFLTWWASTREAVSLLRKAVEIGPRNLLNRLYLAEALRDLDRNGREEAVRLIEAILSESPRPDFLVEERRVQELARADLAQWRSD